MRTPLSPCYHLFLSTGQVVEIHNVLRESEEDSSCITYSGLLDKEAVIIKEFYPEEFCRRITGTDVLYTAEEQKYSLRKEKEVFLEKIDKMKRMQEKWPQISVPSPYLLSEANNTVYAIAKAPEGYSPSSVLLTEPSLGELLKYMIAVCDAVQTLHKEGWLYLSCTENHLYLQDTEHVRLSGLENARRVSSFSPMDHISEQTDIKALGTVIEHMLKEDRKTMFASILSKISSDTDGYPSIHDLMTDLRTLIPSEDVISREKTVSSSSLYTNIYFDDPHRQSNTASIGTEDTVSFKVHYVNETENTIPYACMRMVLPSWLKTVSESVSLLRNGKEEIRLSEAAASISGVSLRDVQAKEEVLLSFDAVVDRRYLKYGNTENCVVTEVFGDFGSLHCRNTVFAGNLPITFRMYGKKNKITLEVKNNDERTFENIRIFCEYDPSCRFAKGSTRYHGKGLFGFKNSIPRKDVLDQEGLLITSLNKDETVSFSFKIHKPEEDYVRYVFSGRCVADETALHAHTSLEIRKELQS